MEKMLKLSLQEKKVTSFYNDKEDTGQAFTGYLGAYDDANILIYHISPRGLYDGYILLERDSVFQLDFYGKYEKKIEYLYDSKKQQHQNVVITEDGVLNSLLQFAQQNRYLVYIGLQDSSVTGLIKEFDEENICLEVYTNYGEADGISTVSVEEVMMVVVDSDDEQDMALLAGLN